MKIPVMDGHCDVLSKLLLDPELSFSDTKNLDASLHNLVAGNVRLQAFAIYLSQSLGPPKFETMLRMIDIFQEKVLKHPEMHWVRSKQELKLLDKGRIGALLTVEGLDALAGDLSKLRILFQLGVRMVSLTWNFANWAADGALERRGAGLSLAGVKLVRECDRLGMLLDVSHLNERGFEDVVMEYPGPIAASHSNCYQICPHPRNLKDWQLQEIIRRRGMVGLAFVPDFIKQARTVHILDLLSHIEHICTLGGKHSIGFGSDFDGIEKYVQGLTHSGQYEELINVLLKYYPEPLVRDWTMRNWESFLYQNLP